MNWKKPENIKLVEAILAIETKQEAKNFLRDLMTEKEIEEFAKRLKAAEMLLNKIPYTTIQKETGLSSTTVARVAKWLNGKGGGYKTILGKLHQNSSRSLRRESS